ncbi:hypothetical protein P154DRAFT_576216 [Amniculicola lignicola CBS 123094]|uniref:Uncharacterized protein n=1 Tax=Amniculicola lignicola CBS 123094 TaxID=1392246 RepID=A0A6A5WF02_9PLEO|nr:hypothetical protein P154DRAFT_576216 [Amniculicola lignicola CBS 123094]
MGLGEDTALDEIMMALFGAEEALEWALKPTTEPKPKPTQKRKPEVLYATPSKVSPNLKTKRDKKQKNTHVAPKSPTTTDSANTTPEKPAGSETASSVSAPKAQKPREKTIHPNMIALPALSQTQIDARKAGETTSKTAVGLTKMKEKHEGDVRIEAKAQSKPSSIKLSKHELKIFKPIPRERGSSMIVDFESVLGVEKEAGKKGAQIVSTMDRLLSGRKRKAEAEDGDDDDDDGEVLRNTVFMADIFDDVRKKRKLDEMRSKNIKRANALDRLKQARAAKAVNAGDENQSSPTTKESVGTTTAAGGIDKSGKRDLKALEVDMIDRGILPEIVNMDMARLTRDGRLKKRDPKEHKAFMENFRKAVEYSKRGEKYPGFKIPTAMDGKAYRISKEKERRDFLLGGYDKTQEVLALPKTHRQIARAPCDPDTIELWKSDLERNLFARFVPPDRMSGALSREFKRDPKTGEEKPLKGSGKGYVYDDAKILVDLRKKNNAILTGQPSDLQGFRGLPLAFRTTKTTIGTSKAGIKRHAVLTKGKTGYAVRGFQVNSPIEHPTTKSIKAQRTKPIPPKAKPIATKPTASRSGKTKPTATKSTSKEPTNTGSTTSQPMMKRGPLAPTNLLRSARHKYNDKATTSVKRETSGSGRRLAANYQPKPPAPRLATRAPPGPGRYVLTPNRFSRNNAS